MSLQQLKKELDSLKQKINSRNSQDEYLLSNAREEVKRKINLIGERLRNQGETYVLSEADKEELFKKIRESCEERVKNPYFKRWIKGV
jgi:sugar-specific transcriptional regulator TrmB